MITNHGTHEWTIVPGLTDTGGQNLFVNQFTDCLVSFGFKITIINRGGYFHPLSGELLKGIVYKDEFRRIYYLEDDCRKFVRKEDMHEQISRLSENLFAFIKNDNIDPIMLISHYWDAAALTLSLLEKLKQEIPHVWVPHSLGHIKKRKTDNKENIRLRMDERILAETKLLTMIKTVVSTSQAVEDSLRNDYNFNGEILFIPPCIDIERYFPKSIDQDHPVWAFLSDNLYGEKRDVKGSILIMEISRTDVTKRKDILIKAFSKVSGRVPSSLLVISVDRQNLQLSEHLFSLIREYGIADQTVILGSVWEWLPTLFSISDIYCSPSVMEGFGMSVQEAASCKTAIIASDLIPFATEYLIGENARVTGEGAIIVPSDDIQKFADAMELLLSDNKVREDMSENAYKRTVPQFTWKRVVNLFLSKMELI